jgi:hypothetical protein
MKNKSNPLKKSYSAPAVKPLTEDEAKKILTDWVNCGCKEAEEVLQFLREEQRERSKEELQDQVPKYQDPEEKRKAS